MYLGPIRPRFDLLVDTTTEQAIELLQRAVAQPDSVCVSRVLGRHVDITVNKAIRKRWSPCVQLDLRDQDGRTKIHGLIGPHPNTWTLYLAINAAIALTMFFALGFALVQYSLDQSPWAIWIVTGGLVLLVLMYVVSQIGRSRAAHQTSLLMDLVTLALGTQPLQK